MPGEGGVSEMTESSPGRAPARVVGRDNGAVDRNRIRKDMEVIVMKNKILKRDTNDPPPQEESLLFHKRQRH